MVGGWESSLKCVEVDKKGTKIRRENEVKPHWGIGNRREQGIA